jgi:isopentenyl-diphosphate Delta-isomerase
MEKNNVILVDEQDQEIGVMEKMEAHRRGILHRAFSVFIFDKSGRMLLQQRAEQKYHGGLLWSNTCCSHPYPDESTSAAAHRRLTEELGFDTVLTEIFSFTYKAEVENELIEHEFDHVFAGEYDGELKLNPNEVADYCYLTIDEIKAAIHTQPAKFTSWFRIVFPQVETWWQQQYAQPKQKEIV